MYEYSMYFCLYRYICVPYMTRCCERMAWSWVFVKLLFAKWAVEGPILALLCLPPPKKWRCHQRRDHFKRKFHLPTIEFQLPWGQCARSFEVASAWLKALELLDAAGKRPKWEHRCIEWPKCTKIIRMAPESEMPFRLNHQSGYDIIMPWNSKMS